MENLEARYVDCRRHAHEPGGLERLLAVLRDMTPVARFCDYAALAAQVQLMELLGGNPSKAMIVQLVQVLVDANVNAALYRELQSIKGATLDADVDVWTRNSHCQIVSLTDRLAELQKL